MATHDPAPRSVAQFHPSVPILRVQDLRASVEHYVNVLGFAVQWEQGGMASVGRDRASLMLCEGGQGNPRTWVWIGVGDAQALYREYVAHGAQVRLPPTNYPWACEMHVEDLDGHVLRLGSDSLEDQPISPWVTWYAARPTNRSMPPGAVIPELAYSEVREAAAWLCRAFGFAERLRIGTHRVQLVFGGETVVVTELREDVRPAGDAVLAAPPTPARGGDHAVLVRVSDADAHCARARQAGARIVRAPTDYPYGERQYSAEDPGGHLWTFSQTIADVDPGAWGGTLVGPA